MKTRLLLALAALLFWASGAFAQTQLNVTVPGSGTGFDFDSATVSTPPYWPLVRLWDGTNKMVVNPNGQATLSGGQPVTLPAVQVTADLCTLLRKTTVAISTSSAVTQLVAPISLNQVYICSILVKNSAATSVSLIGGLGSTCATGTPLALAGSTTLANGIPLGALGDGFAPANGGATVMSTTTSGHGVCLEQSGTALLAGYVSYVQSPL
jgi:hypothetical protein